MKKGLLSIIMAIIAITIPTISWAQNIIQFEDQAVKAICVANWDTNGDGELSMDEAAAVTSLGTAFRENKDIVRFNELVNFTGLTEISDYAFYYCEQLQKVIMPQTIKRIGHDAFNNCKKIETVDIPSGVTEIDYQAFFACSSLTSFVVPDGVTNITYNAFTGTGIKHIVPPGYERDSCGVIPESVTRMANQSLLCDNLESVLLPAGVQQFTGNPFVGCNALRELKVEERSPYFYAEGNCIIETATKTVVAGCNSSVIPSSAKHLGETSFCNLNFVEFEVPEGIVSVGRSTFNNSFYLEEVTLPSTLISLDETAFYACRKLTTLRVKRRFPIHIGNILNENALTDLYVPLETSERYKNADVWKNFKNIIEFDAGPVIDIVTVENLINNGDMEGKENSNFYFKTSPGSIREASLVAITDSIGANDSRGIKCETYAKQEETWDNQFIIRFNQPVSEGTKFQISFDYRSEKDTLMIARAQNSLFEWVDNWYDMYIPSTTEWKTYTYEGILDANKSTDQKPFDSFAIDLNYCAQPNKYYFDNVKFEVILEDQCPKPTFKQNGNEVIIQSPFDATIYFTTDGSDPTTNSRHSNDAIVLQLLENTTIRAMAFVEGYEISPVATYAFEYTPDENLEERRYELRMMIDELTKMTMDCHARLYEKDPQQTADDLWAILYMIEAEINEVTVRTENAQTEAELEECEQRIMVIYDELHRLLVEIEEYNPILFIFDGLTAWVGGGATLDEAFAQAGGREVAAQTIAAIVWENTTTLTADMLQGINNPNLLVYVNEASLAPQGIQNVVINGQAKEIILTDATTGNNNFFCPQAFRAEKISYTRNFRQATQIGISRGWEGIALPFNVQTITHETKGALAPFGTGTGVKHFWLRAYDGENMYSAQQMEAYAPYVIAMPNSNDYYADYNLAGRVTFSATNTEVYETPDFSFMENEPNMPLMTVPAFQRKAQSDSIYAINVGQARGNYAEGSVFEKGLREVRPFEIYTVHHGQGARPRFIPITAQGNESTGIETIENNPVGNSWYSLDGRKMQGQPKSKGVYIQNGKKVVVR